VLTFNRFLILAFLLTSCDSTDKRLWGNEGNVVDSLLSAMEQSRRTLVSGVAEARGTRLLTDGSTVVLDGEMRLLIAFEPKNKLRFDRSEPCLSVSVPSARDNNEAAMCVSRYARDDSKSYYLEGSDFAVVVNEASKIPHFRAPPFDIRAFGLYYWQSFERGKDLAEVITGMRNSSLVAHKIEDKIILECEVGSGAGLHLRHLQVDAMAGFTPVLLEAFKKKVGSGSFEETPFLVEKVEWESVAGTYVPTKFSIRDTFVPNKSREVQLTLDWSYVNQDVPDTFFSESSFEESSLKALVDMRAGDPILLRPLPASEFPEPVMRVAPLGLRGWALIANFAVLIIAVAYFGWSLFNKRKV
jgi:hypothetical protein